MSQGFEWLAQVTRERIRQIEAKAILKLRHPNRSGALREYLCDHEEGRDQSHLYSCSRAASTYRPSY